jgi:hypothetical protein
VFVCCSQALGGGTLQQVVNSGADNHALAARVDGKSTDLDIHLLHQP